MSHLEIWDTRADTATDLAKSWQLLYDALRNQDFTKVEAFALLSSYVNGYAGRADS